MDKVLLSSESNEHYTPDWFIDLVIKVMGGIDLDPCAAPERRIEARTHFHKEHNGLSEPWAGRVFMNPPYGDELPRWTRYARRQYELGNMSEGILLLPARPDTEWMHRLYGFPVCWWKGRIKFISVDGYEQDPAPFPSAVVYMGDYRVKFRNVFQDYGHIMLPH